MEENLQVPNLDFLSIPISELPVTEMFMLRSKLMGFVNLADVIASDLREVSVREDYSERWYFELVSIFQRHGLLHLLMV